MSVLALGRVAVLLVRDAALDRARVGGVKELALLAPANGEALAPREGLALGLGVVLLVLGNLVLEHGLGRALTSGGGGLLLTDVGEVAVARADLGESSRWAQPISHLASHAVAVLEAHVAGELGVGEHGVVQVLLGSLHVEAEGGRPWGVRQLEVLVLEVEMEAVEHAILLEALAVDLDNLLVALHDHEPVVLPGHLEDVLVEESHERARRDHDEDVDRLEVELGLRDLAIHDGAKLVPGEVQVDLVGHVLAVGDLEGEETHLVHEFLGLPGREVEVPWAVLVVDVAMDVLGGHLGHALNLDGLSNVEGEDGGRLDLEAVRGLVGRTLLRDLDHGEVVNDLRA